MMKLRVFVFYLLYIFVDFLMSPRLLIIIGVFYHKTFLKAKIRRNYQKKLPFSNGAGSKRSGALSLRKAAEIVNVHKSTLYDRVTKRVSLDAKPGGKPVLSNEIEKEL